MQLGKANMHICSCKNTLAPSHSRLAVREAGDVAADAKYKKLQKYMYLTGSHYLLPLLWSHQGCQEGRCVAEVAGQVELATDYPFAHQYLVQCILAALQRGNAAALLGCMGARGGGQLLFAFSHQYSFVWYFLLVSKSCCVIFVLFCNCIWIQ